MTDLDDRIAGLSPAKQALLRKLAGATEATEPRIVGAAADAAPAPLSFAQQRLWFLEQLEPETARYNICRRFALTGRLDADRLCAAIDALVARHAILRTTFEANGELVQRVAPVGSLGIAVEDLAQLAPAERAAAADAIAAAEAERPFDLTREPGFRARLLRLADDEHALIATLHHAMADGWSLGIWQRELIALYRGEALPDVLSYSDYARWQREHAQLPAYRAAVERWRSELADAPVASLPADHARRAIASPVGAVQPRALPASLSAGVRELARREGATPFMVLLAAWQAVMFRLTGERDLVVGTPVANRPLAELDGVMGCLANTVALRTRLTGALAFRELLARVQATCAQAFSHQHVPFEAVVEAVNPERSLARSPVFQVLFSLAPREPAEAVVDGDAPLRLTRATVDTRFAAFELSLLVEDTGETFAVEAEYLSALFEPETVARWLRYYERLLAAVVGEPTVQLQRIALIDDDEARWLRERAGRAAAAPFVPVHQRVAERTAASPDAIALVGGDAPISYRELDERANRLAHLLVAGGIGAESIVAVVGERSAETAIALLGVLKAGAAYLPIDASAPAQRIATLLGDAQVRAVIRHPAVALPALDVPAYTVPATDERTVRPPDTTIFAEQLAYVIYTSGSTGQPKGVQVSHGSLASHAAATIAAYQLAASDRVLHFASPGFDVATEELFPTWCAGARAVVYPASEADGADELTRLVAAAGLTVLNLPASYWQSWLATLGEVQLPPSLRLVIAGSEPVTAADVARWRAVGSPATELMTAYGVTEATITATLHALAAADDARLDAGAPVPIGAPLSGSEAFVLDDQLAPVPTGAAGELYLGGPGVARGYLGRPGLTAERFVPHPFTPGARLYRTGDRARWRRDGSLALLGRSDDQLKLRGFRIEPGEVEAALLAHPQIAACAVVARELAGGPQLIAYVVGEARLDELRADLAQRLPRHMVPARFVALPALPRTASGKVARGELPAPDLEAAPYAPPATPDEDLVAALWRALLGVPRVSRDDDFFALGGHSLLAMQLIARLRAAGAALSVRAVFEAPVLAALAQRVAAARADAQPSAPVLAAMVRRTPLPLSFAQERVWFLEQLRPDGALFAMPYAVALRGPLDAALLERCLAALIARHEALRTTFPVGQTGAPESRVAAALDVPLALLDLSDAPDSDQAAHNAIAREAQRPFDLAAGPLIRAHLFRVAEQHHVLLLAMHHIVADGWSIALLERELGQLYEALGRGAPSPLPPLAAQYVDFAIWQRQAMQGDPLDGELVWWRDELAGAPELLALPFDRPRPAAQSYRGAFQSLRLGPAARDAVRRLAQAHGATPFIVLLAVFDALLARLSGQDDLVVGTPVAGRELLHTEDVVGCFLNVVAVRAQLAGDPSFAELVARVRERCLAAYDHQQLPFDQLVQAQKPERNLRWHPIYQVMFTHHPEAAPASFGPLAVSPIAVRTDAAKVDLALATSELADGLELTLEYSADLFDDATIARMLGQLASLIDHATAAPDERVSRLRLVAGEERDLVVWRWNATAGSTASDTVHARFARQAVRAPDHPALVQGDARLSYGALDRRSSQLAGALRRLGVGPDVQVGICLARSFDMVAGVLGVLKAGGAYLPLDPDHPPDRLAGQLDDAAAPVVITHSALVARLGDHGGRVLLVDGALDGADQPFAPARPDHLAYVIYTSGSTGRPKGVQVVHAGVSNVIDYSVRRFAITSDDVVLQLAPLGFDASVLELFVALTAGATAVLLPPEAVGSVPDIARLIDAHAVSVIAAPPSLLEVLPDGAYPRLRTVISGGEACTRRLAARWGAGRRFYNAYAPTEATIYATLHEFADEPGAVSAGLPITNLEAYVLDRHLEPLPIGVAGELYLGGTGLARGYHRRPGLTAERFVPHPFTARTGARLYRTGDLARRRSDGGIELTGRTDHQIKLRGYRIELGEIEALLMAHPAVREAVVIVREDSPGVPYLAAYVVAPGAAPTAHELRSHVARSAPSYMVPTAVTVLDALPLMSSGKLDLAALPAPALAGGSQRIAPANSIEHAVAAVFAEVLGVPPDVVSADDSFFALGGNSLLATSVVSRLRQRFACELSVRTLFEAPTIHQLADAIVQLELAGASAAELAHMVAALQPEGHP